jgi:ligand-binding sensor domain-containing protein/signal transduction histidine kinase/DNA-binding response OmpR family regulator
MLRYHCYFRPHWLWITLPLLLAGLNRQIYSQSINLTQISTKQGLPGSNIRKLHQDSIGFIWFGVEAVGLCKYDGIKFKVFDYDPDNPYSISNNFIWDIVSDKRNLWIATENGLNLYYRDKNRFYNFFSDNSGLTDNWVVSLFLDHQKNLWIGTSNGLNKLPKSELEELYMGIGEGDNITSSFKLQHFLYDDSITKKFGKIQILHISEDKQRNLWISTDAGVFIVQPETNTIKHLYHKTNSTKGLIHNYVHFTVPYKKDRFLIGTDRGLCLYDPHNNLFKTEVFPEIKKLKLEYKGYYCYFKDSNGTEWLGMSEGIMVINNNTTKDHFKFISKGVSGLTSKIIRDITEDNSGQIWIGTKYGGLYQLKKHQDIFRTYTIDHVKNKTNRKEDNYILSLFSDSKDNIWIGTKYGGLYKYNYKSGDYESFWIDLDLENPANSNRIEFIYEDSNNDIWTGTLKGLNKLDPRTKQTTLYPFYQIRTILEDKKGNFWIGTQQGLYIFDREKHVFNRFTESSDSDFFQDSSLIIYTMIEDRNSNLWFGTYENGIYLYSNTYNKITHFSYTPDDSSSIQGNMIRDIYEDDEGIIWIGTKHNGLNYYLADKKKFKNLSKTNGLPSNTIYSIQSDYNDNLWIGTHNGLSVYNKKDGAFQNFDETHGLQSNIFENDAKTMTHNGYLLFGGRQGFNMFDPKNIIVNPHKCQLAIKSVKINNKEILVDLAKDTSIALKYFQNYIDFDFVLLSFINPSKTTYKYMLEGIDKEWVDAETRNYVSYSDLKHGEYTFRLKGIDADKSGTSNPINLHIIISPPYWKTNFAKIVYMQLIIFLIYAVYKIATFRVNYRYRLNESRKEIHQTMEINEAKLRFFTNISHELQTPLALISAPVESLSQSRSLNEKEKNYVQLIQKNTNRLNQLIEQLLYFRKTQNEVIYLKARKGDIIRFLREITKPYSAFARQNQIDFRFTHHEMAIDMWFDPDKIEKIMSNLLMNAFKFTPRGGRVEIIIEQQEHNTLETQQKIILKKDYEKLVYIHVKDTGKGMSKNDLKNIFQRYYIASNNKGYRGTGIGLELTKTLVEMHGGKIHVDSELDHGSTFTVTLFKDSNHFKKTNISDEEIIVGNYISKVDYLEIYQDTNSMPQLPPNKPLNTDRPLILLVDDNDELRNFLGNNLSEHYNVALAKNGKEGFDLATKKIPDLIISDIIMPEMDGISLCKKTKTSPITSHIPIILLTRKTQIEDKIKGLQTGADDYVGKPFNMQYLLLRINNLFHSNKMLKSQILKKLNEGKIESEDISSYDKNLLNKYKDAVFQNLSNADFSVTDLGRIVGMSRSQLYRKIMALTGQSPAEFIYSYRLLEAEKLLLKKENSVMDIAHLTGFKSSNSFSTVFKKNYGISPKEFMEKKQS